jgi:hypothetical protein
MFEQLTEAQTALFYNLARLTENGALISPFIPIPAGVDEYTLYLRGSRNFYLQSYDDLNALCAVGLLDWELTRMGAYKQFTLSKFGIAQFRSIDQMRDIPPVSQHPVATATQHLQAAVRQMLHGAALDNVLREIERVNREFEGEFANAWRVQRAVQAVGEAVTKRYGQISLREMSDVALCYGRWCQAVARAVEQQVETLYV